MLRGPDWMHGRCTTPDEYLALQAAFIAKNAAELPGRYGHVKPHEVSAAITAYVNHGNWLVDCPCGNGCATSPTWRIACCFSCGAIYRRIMFPEMAKEIEGVLVARPVIHQNWLPHETVADLLAENAQHLTEGAQ